MALQGLGYTGLVNGSVVFDPKCGCVGVVYDGKLWSIFKAGSSNASSYTLNGVTWTAPSSSQLSTFLSASGLGRTCGETIFAISSVSAMRLYYSSGYVHKNYGCTDNYYYYYCCIAYRTL